MTFLRDLARDSAHALRMLRRTPGFTATAVAVLAVGIGGNTAVFSVVNDVLLRPLPYPEADRIVQLMTDSRVGPSRLSSIPKFILWRDGTSSFEAVAAYQAGDPGANLLGSDVPEHLDAMHVSREYFVVFRAPFALGRNFSPGEDRPYGPRAAIVSNGFWKRRFGADPEIVGRALPLGRDAYEVVGVLGPDFAADSPADVFLPLQADPFSQDHASTLRVAARLKPAATVRAAAFEVMTTTARFRRMFPLALGPWQEFTAAPLADVVAGDVRPALRMLSAAVVFVLLIACANVANLLLARGHRRRREIATRAALGAGRWRIVRQLLTESALLMTGGALAGVAAGYAGVRALTRIAPAAVLHLNPLRGIAVLEPAVLTFSAVVAAATGIAFGVVPALTVSRVDLGTAFTDAGTTTSGGWRRHRLQSALVVGEVMLALVLLVGAGLLIKTVMALRSVDRGFDPRGIVSLDVTFSGAGRDETASIVRVVENARQRIAAVPGVAVAAVSRALPVEPSFTLSVDVDRPVPALAAWRSISPRYFDVFRMPLRDGRAFTELDSAGAAPVAIVNAAFAAKFWRTGSPVGARIRIGANNGPALADVPRIIVGVVADARDLDANRDPDPAVYVPLAQVSDAMTARNNRLFPLTWAVRTSGNPMAFAGVVARELRGATGLSIARVRSMEEIVAASTARAQFNMALLTTFAGVALLLAIIGLYGLMSYSVQQRTQEIGIRMALGAASADVQSMVLGQGLRLALTGVALGVGAALVLTRLMVNLVFGVKTWDPGVFAAVASLLCAVALAAAYIPARRATRVNPLIALTRT
jgi:putative ABC transport system permease protein